MGGIDGALAVAGALDVSSHGQYHFLSRSANADESTRASLPGYWLLLIIYLYIAPISPLHFQCTHYSQQATSSDTRSVPANFPASLSSRP